MNQEIIQKTIDRNPAPLKTCHMVGIKCEGGIHVIKCDPNPSLVGTLMDRSEWRNYPTFKVSDGIPRRATLQPVIW